MADLIPINLGDLYKALTKEQLNECTARAMNRSIVKAENFDKAYEDEVQQYLKRLWPHQLKGRRVDRGWKDDNEYDKKE